MSQDAAERQAQIQARDDLKSFRYLGDALHFLRRERGQSRQQLGRAVGLEAEAIERLESGGAAGEAGEAETAVPVAALLDALGVPLLTLIRAHLLIHLTRPYARPPAPPPRPALLQPALGKKRRLRQPETLQ
jgi:transcriptional regulator with XRE-family HTH domain